MRFKIISLGCPKNLVESEYITASLEEKGNIVSEEHDTVIINTCAFITDAVKESIEIILAEKINLQGHNKKLVVTGCLVERYGEKLQELLPEVDLFVGRNFYDEIGKLIDKKGFFWRQGLFSETFPRKVLTAKPTAYLKIQEGCDNRCSYCTVPDIRGSLRSRSMESIREELEWLLAQGFREINIIGQDITSYGKHENLSLRELLTNLLSVKGDYFLRLLYMHPRGINEDLIDLFCNEDRIIKYLDIPIQHSEDNVLARMGRGYSKRYLEELFGKIRNKIPDAILRTTVIVGFPGETEDEFLRLSDFIKEWEFDMLGAFMYSREEGTKASKLKGQFRKGIKNERYNTIMAIQNDISKQRLKRFIGRKMKVIVEGKEGGYMAGRLIIQAPDIDGMAFIKGSCITGEIRDATIVKTLDYDVIVEL